MDEAQSRHILLFYFWLVETGRSPERAVADCATALLIDKKEIYAVGAAAEV